MIIDFITDLQSIKGLKAEWASLLEKSGNNNLFLSWEWNYYWCRNMLQEQQTPYILTATQDDQLIGLAPLLIENNSESGKSIQFLVQPYSYHLGFIVEKGSEELVYNDFVNYLLNRVHEGDFRIEFIHLEDDPLLMSCFDYYTERFELDVERGFHNPCKVLKLPDNFETYFKTGIGSTNLRHNINKDLRRLDNEYEMNFSQANESNFQQYWNELLSLHRDMMRNRNKCSVLLGDAFPALLQQIAEIALEKQNLRLNVLKVNGDTAAIMLGIVYNGVFNALTIGVNSQLIQRVPWLNLTILSHTLSIKSAIESKCKQFDFGGGRHDYKYKLGGKDTGGVKITINPPKIKQPIAIITHALLNPDHASGLNIGGVENWLMELVKLLVSLGFSPVVYQTSKTKFTTNLAGTEIIGLGVMDRDIMTRLSHHDIDCRGIKRIIYASSFVGVKNFRPDQVFIQHGIHWDYTTSPNNFWLRLKWEFIRRKLNHNDLKKTRESRLTITVDSNYLNYSRIMLHHRFDPMKIRYIPNFAILQDPETWKQKWQNPEEIQVVFARRFETRRGVIIFAEALEKILQISPNIRVTFAGSGSLSDFITQKFADNPRVSIVELPHDKVYELLCRSHVAVIPSTYSEGTSLSCLEAMASGCAIVATDVGGLCNIVLPDYNGIQIRPIAGDIVSSVTRLVNNLELAETFAKRGYEMVQHSFSLSLWRKRIEEALKEAGLLNFTDETNPKK